MSELTPAELKKQRGCAVVLILLTLAVVAAFVVYRACGGFVVIPVFPRPGMQSFRFLYWNDCHESPSPPTTIRGMESNPYEAPSEVPQPTSRPRTLHRGRKPPNSTTGEPSE